MQGQPLIFVDEKAILMESVMFVDFSNAKPTNEDRRLKIHLRDGSLIIVKDPTAIDLLVGVFIPEHLRPRYTSQIAIVRN